MLTQEHIPAAYKNRLEHYQVKKEYMFDFMLTKNGCSIIMQYRTVVRDSIWIIFQKIQECSGMEYSMDHGRSRISNIILLRADMRRRQDAYRRKFFLVMILFILMSAATLTLSIKSFAYDRSSETPSYKYYTSYTVQSGDSLKKIASAYMTDEYSSIDRYVAEIVSINHLFCASDISEGTELIIPYYDNCIK